MSKKFLFFLSLAGLLVSACNNLKNSELSTIEEGFKTPPDSVRPGTYWYWINEHVSKEGITKDLEALYRIGVREAFIGNIYEDRMPRGAVRTLSPEWEDCMRFALTEGKRIGIKVSSFNCPGWSMAGGPWVKPDEAMRYITYSEADTKGGGKIKAVLPKPKEFFQDVAVLAYREPLSNAQSNVIKNFTYHKNSAGEPATALFKFPAPSLMRTLIIMPDKEPFSMTCEVYAKQNGDYQLVKSAYFDRLTDNLSYGPEPYAPLCISLGETTAQEFKVVMLKTPAKFSLKSIELTAEAKIEHYSEKLNNKMPLIATPDWFSYQWKPQQEPSREAVVNEADIINVSEFMHGDTLVWDAPDGLWHVMRLGMAPTLKTNKPSAPDATGLEIDKMSRKPLQHHYDSYIGKIVRGLPDGLTFNRVIADSYETGPGSWTDGFREIFTDTYGYDPVPWLALFSGQIVGSADMSERFMWDMRRLVADRIASEFVGGMADLFAQNGSSLWLENYGWDGFPSEFLKYAKLSPSVGGEYWTTSPNVECRLAASACHIYDKNVIYAESYTTGGHLYEFHPRTLKQKGDEAYIEGVNQHIMHLAIHQPYNDKAPGINSWFGIELNRHNTWFEQAKAWIDYQSRCCFMLQQGKPAADVCFFIGEDCPKMAGWKDPSLSQGYDYDFINADVIINDLTVKDGRLTLPSGVSYALLALPPLTTMRPELLAKIEQLVLDGASIIGSPVDKSPSLQNYPQCDKQLQETASRLWKQNTAVNDYGKGKVFYNTNINSALEAVGASEAVRISGGAPVLWKQRDLPNGRRIYFVTNQSDKEIAFDISFRTNGLQPEWWDAVDGSTRALVNYSVQDGYTTIPLRLDALESGFVVFRNRASSPAATAPAATAAQNYFTEKTLLTVPDKWDIELVNRWTGESYVFENSALFDWTQHPSDNIRYFSGTATYKNVFNIPASICVSDVYIAIEEVGVVATVFVNGVEAGTIWTKPYRLKIGDLLKEGDNILEIKVSNVWRNKVVDKLNNITPNNPVYLLDPPSPASYGKSLIPSGITGAVKLVEIKLADNLKETAL